MQINIKRTVASAAATAVLMFGSLTPVAFAQDITISGNGSSSTSTANVSAPQTTTVSQTNSANITNNVTTEASTGDNHANGNTGGSVTVGTGPATSTVNVTNNANANIANPNPCCRADGTVEISGNGEKSYNTANLSAPTSNTTAQSNTANFTNRVKSEAETGENSAYGNTGGDVSVSTGAANSTVNIHNTANANVVGGGSGTGTGGTLSVKILDNGKESVNTVNLAVPQTNTIAQTNSAHINNWVESEAETGENHANGNTGGDVSVGTGAATSMVDISNLANFNSADIDCGCLLDLNAKIAGNGEKTFNTINAAVGNTLALGQANGGEGFNNTVRPEAETGDNQANGNTEGDSTDPSVNTGAAVSNVTLSNTGNANVAGSSPLPVITLGGLSLSFGFDWVALLAMLH